MRDSEFCAQILKLDNDWTATNIEIDSPSNRVDISITKGGDAKHSLFSWYKKDDDEEYEILRHLPIFNMRAFLHVPKSALTEENNAWKYPDSKYTKAMEDMAITALKSAKSIQGVCDITGLLPSDVREISERSGITIEKIDTVPDASSNETMSQEAAIQSFELIEMGNVPEETHPSWSKLIQGQLELPSNAVGLKMLLQRVRNQIDQDQTEITRLANIRLLRQYFHRNASVHQEDIDILNGSQTIHTGERPTLQVIHSDIPTEDHECWERLISGELNLKTKHVGLQMMIERVKTSANQASTENTKLAAKKILRQFFVKHRARLSAEMAQLGIQLQNDAYATTVKMPAVITVPAQNHDCWEKLLKGTITLDTKTVGLQMMLERLKMSISKNPSESNRAAGIKILHQYFTKHQSQHREEILTLLGLSTETTNANEDFSEIPAEDHPNWQRLIDGDLEITTDVIALKMMLERIRMSVEKSPSASNRMAGAKILRQYFIKHQQKHRTELNKLVAA